MLPIGFLTMVMMVFSVFLLLVVGVLSGRYSVGRVKMSPFECGFDPKESARLPFSVRFFLLAVVFLVFDIEVVLLFPLVFGAKFYFYVSTIIAGLGFLFILVFGVLHEWRSGALSWVF